MRKLNLTKARCVELRHILATAEKATQAREQAETAYELELAKLNQKRSALNSAKRTESRAVAKLQDFLANATVDSCQANQPPQHHPSNKQVAENWVRRCEADASRDAERVRKAQFTKLG